MDEQFSVRQALAAGMSRGTLRRLDIPFRGSRDISEILPATDRYHREHQELLRACRAYLPVAPTEFAFSHVTAARIYGMPLSRRLASRPALDVSVPGNAQPPRRVGVVGHRGLAGIQTRHGLPVVPPELAWLQVAALLTADELVVAGDYLIRRNRPLSTLDRLRSAVVDAGRMRGVAAARTALGDIRAGTDSPPESRLRLVLIRAGLPEPCVGFTVFHEGAFVGTPDLAYVEQRIAIEYEGEDHRTDPEVYESDIYRREMFERAGWRTYLVTAARLRNPAAVAAHVRGLLRGV